MEKRRFSRVPARLLVLITLGALLVLLFPSSSTNAVLPSMATALSTASPSPVPTPNTEQKRPNTVRRFFSWVGGVVTRPFRRREVWVISDPPFVDVTASKSLISFCRPDLTMITKDSCSPGREVDLSASVGSPENDARSLFLWNVPAGRLSSGEGSKVTWDLTGVAEGTYTARVEWNDGSQLTANGSTTVTIARCSACVTISTPCPSLSVACPSVVDSKQPLVFLATVAGGNPDVKPTYSWSVTSGKIISGQGTSKLTVDVSNLGSRSITATVTLGGDFNPSCPGFTASCTSGIN